MQKHFRRTCRNWVKGKLLSDTTKQLQMSWTDDEKILFWKIKEDHDMFDLFSIESSANFASFNFRKWPFGAQLRETKLVVACVKQYPCTLENK